MKNTETLDDALKRELDFRIEVIERTLPGCATEDEKIRYLIRQGFNLGLNISSRKNQSKNPISDEQYKLAKRYCSERLERLYSPLPPVMLDEQE